MKRTLMTITLGAAVICASAQYFGSPLFTEGFETESDLSGWTQTNTGEGSTTEWTLSTGDVAKFSDIVADNTHSARIAISDKNTCLTLTSPEIDATGKEALQVGFYGNELSYAFRGNIDFRFRASADGGETWTDLFSALSGSSYIGTQVGQWNLYRYNLPSEFDGKKILLQFLIDSSTAWSNPQGLPGYIDGIFLSVLPECDPAICAINYSTNDRLPSSGAYGSEEPLKLTVKNEGTHELTSVELYYSINGGQEFSEICTFPTPLKRGETYLYTFTKGIDLSSSSRVNKIVAGVRFEGDEDISNNEVIAYAENTVASVPYVPAFIYDDEGATVTGKDGWTTFENNMEYGWEFEDWYDIYWYVEPEYNDDPNDAWLVSRPIRMTPGKYRLQFSASTEDVTDAANIMEVWIGTDEEMDDDPFRIWREDSIEEENALNTVVVFDIEEAGIYYLGFHSLSEAEAGLMRLENIGLYKNVDTDAAIMAVTAPEPTAYKHSAEEPVSVKIANHGVNPIASGKARVAVSVDGKKILDEAVSKTIAPNTTIDHTLNGKLDLSKLGHRYDLVISVIVDGDEDNGNDSKSFVVESDVTLVPYIPDFGTQVQKGHDVAFWSAEDTNADGYTFTSRGDNLLDAYSFSYGGGLYGFSTVTLPNSDDRLISRIIELEGSKIYKLAFASRVGEPEVSLPLEINLCSVKNGSRTVVSKIHSTLVSSPDYEEEIITFPVDKSGDYQIEFVVKTDMPIDYRIYLGKFRLTELFANDLSIEEVVVPSDFVSGIKTLPVGALIRNNSSTTVKGVTLTAECESTGIRKVELANALIEADATYLIYFPEDFNVNGTKAETLTLTVSTDGDAYTANNTLSRELKPLETQTLPYRPMPEEAREQMAVFNLNRDNYRFMTDRTLGVGYMYVSDGTKADDYLATPALRLEAEKPVRVSFTYHVLEGDATDFDVFAYDAANDVTIPVISLIEADQTSMNRFTGFFSVPADGDYNLCFLPKGNAGSLFIGAAVSVEEAAGLPDLRIGSLVSHKEPGVFGDKETVIVEFTSEADNGVQSVPFELEVGDKLYHSIFTKYTSRSTDDTYQIVFNDVDLSEPGDISLVCRATVTLDSNPLDNEKTFIVKSLPVVDVAVSRLVNPRSGSLGQTESVSVLLENKGKGDISDFSIKASVKGPDGKTTDLNGNVSQQIPTGGELTYTFRQTLNMFAEGVYTFTVTAEADGDVNTEDNILEISVNSTAKPFDAGVSAIVSPVDAALTDAETISIEVSNYGETDLFDIPVNVTVSRGGSQIAALSGTLASLKAGAKGEYSFAGTVDMIKPGEYIVKAWTGVENDIDSSNDMTEKNVRCLTQDVGVTAILSPVSGVDLGIVDVIVEVTNFGEADVKNIPMMYQIGSMPQMAVMEETVKSGETVTFKFPVPYEFTSNRKATVRAATMLENDVDPSNDELTVEIENSGIDNVTADFIGLNPNPTSGHLRIAAAAHIETVMIFDLNGKLVLSAEGNSQSEIHLDLDLAAGQYAVVVKTSVSTLKKRLIIR